MSEISYADALETFGRWERQSERLAVLGSNSGLVISLRGAPVTLCLDDMPQLTFSEDGTSFSGAQLFLSQIPKIFRRSTMLGLRNLKKGSDL